MLNKNKRFKISNFYAFPGRANVRKVEDHSFVFIVDNRKSFRGDLRKPFDILLKGSFRLINAVIPSVERTKKDSGSILYGDGQRAGEK